MKKIICLLVIIISIVCYCFYSNAYYKKYLKSFGSSYRTKLSYYDSKDNYLMYDYSNNVEAYLDESLEVVKYKDFNKKKIYRYDDNKFIISPLIYESNNSSIYKLLKGLKVKYYFNGVFTFFSSKKHVKRFLNNYKDYITYDSRDNYKVSIMVKNNHIKEINIFSSKDKYLKFSFSKFNKIEKIQSPIM